MKRKSAHYHRHVPSNRRLADHYYYVGDSNVATEIRLTQYKGDLAHSTDVKLTEPSFLKLVNPDYVNWFQVTGLTDADTITRIVKDFGFDRLDAKDILTPHHVVKVEKVSDKRYFIIMNAENYNEKDELTAEHICLLVSGNVIISFVETNPSFFEPVHSALKANLMDLRNQSAFLLLAFLLNTIAVCLIECATKIQDYLEDVEDRMLDINSNQADLGSVIQQRRREYLQIRRNSLPLKDQFIKLIPEGEDEKKIRPVYVDLNDQVLFVCQTVEDCRELIYSLVDLYVSNNDLRMNAIMKRLTVVSTIFIPLTFLVGVWGMNFKIMPELEFTYGYFFAWILMIVVALATWFFLKKKDWF